MPEIYLRAGLYFENYLIDYELSDIEARYSDVAFDILKKHLKDTSVKPVPLFEMDKRRGIAISDYEDDDYFDIMDPDEIYSEKFWKNTEIAEAMRNAAKEFDETVMTDITRVINTETKDLPLLIGLLKDPDAIKLMERLFK